MKKRYLAIILATALVFVMAGVGTMAWFTNEATSSNNTFQAGTLILGYNNNGTDVSNEFASLTFDNLSPGGDPTDVSTTELKNVGTLPFYLYRITADNFVDNNDDDIDDLLLDDVLMVSVLIKDEFGVEREVFRGKLTQLKEENGGYFDPMYFIDPQETREMKMKVWMDETADNFYQGLSMSCDFTVYASQHAMPLPGETGNYEYLATCESFDPSGNLRTDVGYFKVYGKNNGTSVSFQYRWHTANGVPIPDPGTNKDWYELRIKHHTGDPNKEIFIKVPNSSGDEIQVTDLNNINHPSLAGYITFNNTNEIVTIEKAFFDELELVSNDPIWDTIEVQFYGKTHHGPWDRITDYVWFDLGF